MRKIKLPLSGLLLYTCFLQAQETFSVNGVADKREACYAFTNATIVKDAQTILLNATMIIREGKIIKITLLKLKSPQINGGFFSYRGRGVSFYLHLL